MAMKTIITRQSVRLILLSCSLGILMYIIGLTFRMFPVEGPKHLNQVKENQILHYEFKRLKTIRKRSASYHTEKFDRPLKCCTCKCAKLN